MKVSVKGDRDPGYGSTSKMLAEAAICLVKDAGRARRCLDAGRGHGIASWSTASRRTPA